MKQKEEMLKEDSKISMLDYSEAVNLLIKNSKQELVDLDQRNLLAKNTLKQTDELNNRKQMEFEQWKREELRKLENEKQKKIRELDARDHALAIGEQNFIRRDQELQVREKVAANLIEEKNKLTIERVDIERLRAKVNDVIKESDIKLSEAQHRLNVASVKEKEVSEKLAKIQAINSNLAVREEKLLKEKENAEAALRNYEKIKEAVEPKLQEINFVEERNKNLLKELQEKETSVLRKIEEESALLKGLEEKEKKLKEKEREILSKEEQIMRKALLSGIK